MSKNSSEHFSSYWPVRITRAKFNQRCNDRKTTESAEFIGIVQDKGLQRYRFPLLGGKLVSMYENCLFDFTYKPGRNIQLLQEFHGHLSRFDMMVLKAMRRC